MTTCNSKRPTPHIRTVKRGDADLEWEPQVCDLFTLSESAPVRAGCAVAVVRPGWERWPLAISSERYKPTSHVSTDAMILGSGAGVRPNGIIMAGQGTHVAYGYFIEHLRASELDTQTVVSTKMIVSHDHTAKGKARASMVLYVTYKEGSEQHSVPVGTLVSCGAMHAGNQVTIWQGMIEGLIEAAVVSQDAVLDLLRAAKARELSDEDRKLLRERGMKLPTTGEQPKTLFDAMVKHHAGRNGKPTWNVWARRLGDEAFRAAISLLGVAYGNAIDEAFVAFRGVRCGNRLVISCAPPRMGKAT